MNDGTSYTKTIIKPERREREREREREVGERTPKTKQRASRVETVYHLKVKSAMMAWANTATAYMHLV
jgi:hypothetical protein